jgi:subtilase family serine protease
MTTTRSILMFNGSLKSDSSNGAVLRTASTLTPPGVIASLYLGLGKLPHFNPDDDHDPLPAPVADLRARIAAADALLICTPEYAGEVAVYAALVSNDVPIASSSWGEPESEEDELTSDDADFKEAAAQGQSVYAIAGSTEPGDNGSTSSSVLYPGSDPYVTGVGCTNLTVGAGNTYGSETVNTSCGYGTSAEWHTPSYQTEVNSGSYGGGFIADEL